MIHSEHPFATPEPERSANRRLRGRWPAGVAIVTTGSGAERVGLTVSSLLVVDGDPGVVVMMLDPLSDLAETLMADTRIVINFLPAKTGELAEVFAGLAPAPGGTFTVGTWNEGTHGPELVGAAAVARATITDIAAHDTGWSRRHEARIDSIDFTSNPVLRHERGSYH